ncbi:hypothetical protein Acy02nite_85510 [Actinoplanes cyaneus]|uniref:Uncharacterized protein n=1 Tax=Actinoplanes cyaneus TaxID=52696 RepID=A0A919M5P2_9ACTN|nr:hypothetical protein [Actinoplanes cyaneus]MCW2143831.1 hypothetical protein [Actinoplanes cyaneus]GID70670.1 hypothetical protein Acy02nite_85510 [Actinoplanes cyaneus]
MPANTWNFRSVRELRRAHVDAVVEVDFGAGVHRLTPWITALDLRALVPGDGPVDWAALDRLPNLSTVSWSGADRGLAEAIARHPQIQYLEWFGAEGDLDLRQTAIVRLWIDGAGLRSLLLPTTMITLLLQGPHEGLRIETQDERYGMGLHLSTGGADVVVPAGLRETPVVRLNLGGEFSVKALEGFTNLRELTLDFEGPPGRLTDLPLLGQHPGLFRLCLINAYEMDPATLPDLPLLSSVELVGTRAGIAAGLRERFAGRGLPEVSVRHARPSGNQEAAAAVEPS